MVFRDMGIDDLLRENFQCQRCGNCCKKLSSSLTISKEEKSNWEDISLEFEGHYYRASEFAIKESEDCFDLFYDPVTEEKLDECPFLAEKDDLSYCKIYENRPQRCKIFPFMKRVIDLTRKNICPEISMIIEENEELIEELRMVVFKDFVGHSIEDENQGE